MAKLPADLGPAVRANPTMPVATYDATPIAKGAAAMAQSVSGLGSVAQGIAGDISDFAQRKASWELAMAMSHFATGKVALDAATAQDTNYGPAPADGGAGG